MFAGVPTAYWIAFHVVVLVLILLDLIVLNRGSESTRGTANLVFAIFVVALSCLFGITLGFIQGQQAGMEFVSGYLIELSLSIDNLFVFLVMFRSLGLGLAEQRKVLLYGVVGAIVMRGLFIFLGITLIERFAWIYFVFGLLLLIVAVRMVRKKPESTGPGKWIERFLKPEAGNPRKILLSAILAVEIVDLVFALDSIPAVLAVTHEPFVVYTSNIFAILGLRSLYFLLANLLDRLRYLHYGLAVILGFVGGKMIVVRWAHIPIAVSLAVILMVVAIAIGASLLRPAKRPAHQEELQ